MIGVDLEIADGLVSAITPAGTFPAGEGPDLGHGLIWPTFVDGHTHLDIGYIWER
ncbi:MAG: cytosine deaminase, partial [Alphaproteobacteria bacterium]|nr:cytosine deaminase [Alphaproteobacteria bacterium]